MKFTIFIIFLLSSCASASPPPESEQAESERTRPANTEAQFEEDLTMVCETSPDSDLKAEDYIALWKEQAQTQKMKALIGEDRESVVGLRKLLESERGSTCAILANWNSIFSPDRLLRETAWRVISSHSTEFEKCYIDLMESGDRRSLKVVTSFTVGEDGKTKDVSAQQFVSVDADYIETDTGPLVDCVVEVYQRMQFPGQEAGEGLVVFPHFFNYLHQ